MKIAHFGVFAPNMSGQYATVKDMIRAERVAGLDAQFIDYGLYGEDSSRIGLKDDWLVTVDMDFAKDADFVIRHSAVPKKVQTWNKSTILALHGRPENSFLLEKYGTSAVITEVLNFPVSGYFSFWESVSEQWEMITGKKVHTLTAPVDLDKYHPDGAKHEFRGSGSPNIIVCDMWREDVTPFNVSMAGAVFQKEFCPSAKIHVYGMPQNEAFENLDNEGVFGEIMPMVNNLDSVYRSADLMITPQVIATRTVREALASGCPIVAGGGNVYTLYGHDPRDIYGFAEMINRAWEHTSKFPLREGARRIAEREFTLDGEDVKRMLEEIC